MALPRMEVWAAAGGGGGPAEQPSDYVRAIGDYLFDLPARDGSVTASLGCGCLCANLPWPLPGARRFGVTVFAPTLQVGSFKDVLNLLCV